MYPLGGQETGREEERQKDGESETGRRGETEGGKHRGRGGERGRKKQAHMLRLNRLLPVAVVAAVVYAEHVQA